MSYFDFHHHKQNFANGIYNLELFQAVPEMPFSAGIHPKDIDENKLSLQIEWLKESINENCFAIGECGLDPMVSATAEVQNKVFLEQINIANELKKPLIIHCVKRFSELIPFRKKSEFPMILHGFNKKQSVADSLLSNNFYLSFGKAVLYNLSLQNTLKNAPLDRLFLETDDADFSIEELYHKVSEIKNISTKNLQDQIFVNLETIKNG
ncbi:TatD family hydrolase [Chryseobacterium caseinilyticum]|uniref:TatD family hydrolase n=1 Tax=Chryseobacterium caseinilyticum TaxID=2771428 RepID=A0ABR8ZD98_9FLAO|nr:TatD family hydrolase [Chryseobacterium caseinilyticum]MBD8083236.1 TatD family hydrolase [Chryseobacterium caseinilyticum]